jgi:tetratricopeptide (TPR) repeat protein
MSRIKELEERKEVGNRLLRIGQLMQARDVYFSILVDLSTLQSPSPSSTIDSSVTSGAGTTIQDSDSSPSSSLTTVAVSTAYQEIEIACLNNLSALFFQLKDFQEVLKLTNKTLQISSSRNVKALYRQAQAYEQLGLKSIALERISFLLEIEPMNQQGRKYLSSLLEEGGSVTSPSSSSPSALPETAPPETAAVTATAAVSEQEVQNNPPPSLPHAPSSPLVSSSLEGSTSPSPTHRSHEEAKEETASSSGYGFMNTSWSPPVAPPTFSSSTSSLLPSVSQTLQTEVAKKKIKQTILLSAISSLHSATASSVTSSSSVTTTVTNSTARVQHVFENLLQEEEKELKEFQQLKIHRETTAAATGVGAASGETPSGGKKKKSASRSSNKSVISLCLSVSLSLSLTPSSSGHRCSPRKSFPSQLRASGRSFSKKKR